MEFLKEEVKHVYQFPTCGLTDYYGTLIIKDKNSGDNCLEKWDSMYDRMVKWTAMQLTENAGKRTGYCSERLK